MSRHIVYITGTRADFGLMRRTLQSLATEPSIELSVVVTGMHLSTEHGYTLAEVEASGLAILARVPIETSPATGATMARGIGSMVQAFTDVLAASEPDLVLLLGDRGEMLAAAIAALHLDIAIAHLHGGELSGTVDEPVRHAISKLSHLHLTATSGARDRLVKMGEKPDFIHVTGAPGLDGVLDGHRASKHDVALRSGLDPERPVVLMIFHPVLREAATADTQTKIVLDAILECEAQALVLMPNADAGSDGVRSALEAYRGDPRVALTTHLEREAFLDAMGAADAMVGNSSAGIIEAASFGTPVINIGTRQNLRERNRNVVDVPPDRCSIVQALSEAIRGGRCPRDNVYGDGCASARILAILRDIPLDERLKTKINGY